jgi:hypothetical protein
MSAKRRRAGLPRPTRGRGMGTATMVCPNCGEVSRVLRTSREGGIITRHRECNSPSCAHRFHTSEVVQDETVHGGAAVHGSRKSIQRKPAGRSGLRGARRVAPTGKSAAERRHAGTTVTSWPSRTSSRTMRASCRGSRSTRRRARRSPRTRSRSSTGCLSCRSISAAGAPISATSAVLSREEARGRRAAEGCRVSRDTGTVCSKRRCTDGPVGSEESERRSVHRRSVARAEPSARPHRAPHCRSADWEQGGAGRGKLRLASGIARVALARDRSAA